MSHPRHQNTVDLMLQAAGAAAADNNVAVVRVPFDGFIQNIFKGEIAGPTGADEVLDLNKNGTTVFAAAGKITTADGTVNKTYSALTSGAEVVSEGDELSLDIDSTGGTPGEGVYVGVRISRTRTNAGVTNVAPETLN